MKRRLYTRLLAVLLAVCIFAGIFPEIPVRAAEMQGGTFDPRTGSMTLEFGYQSTQYVNINVYVRSANSQDGSGKIAKGSIAKGVLLSGVSDVACFTATENTEEPYEVEKFEDPSFKGVSEDGIYKMTQNSQGEPIEPVDMMAHTLTWDGTINGLPIIGPNLNEDMFILTVEIEPLGRPEWNVIEKDEEGKITGGKDYSWTHDKESKKYAISTDVLVDYRNYAEGEEGKTRFIMLKGGLSDKMTTELYEAFLSGSMTCSYLTNHPDVASLVMDHSNLDPVDMITGNYQFTYTDLKLESAIPLSFTRAYNSRYDAGSLGKGFTHSYEYSLEDDRGIISVTMPGGEAQVFLRLGGGYGQDYDSLQDSDFTLEDTASGYIMRHKDGASFAFTPGGQLTSVTNPDGVLIAELSYNGDELSHIDGIAGSYYLEWNDGHIMGITDSAGRSVKYGYSGENLTSVTNPDGDTLHYTYDGNGYLASVSDFSGDVYVSNAYDDLGRVTEQHFWNADQEMVSTISYDDENKTNTCVDFNGRTVKYIYDSHRNIVKIEDSSGASSNSYSNDIADSFTDKHGNALRYDVDSNGNITGIHYQDGTASTLSYDGAGNITAVTDAEGGTESFTYSGSSVTSYQDKNGNTTQYAYNSLGLVSEVTDALGGVTSYDYDSTGRLDSVTNAAGETTRYRYDGAGRVAEVTDPMGGTTSYSYSDAGKLLETVDALGNSTTYEYNANGFITCTTDALSNSASTEYGTNGQPLSETDARGNTTYYSYNGQGKISTVTDPMGNITSYAYDQEGRLIKAVDGDGHETAYTYDALGQVTSVTDGLGNTTSYEYDPMGRMTSVIAANGASTRYAYDRIGRTVQVTDGEGGITSYAYDGNGNTLSVTDAEGITVHSAYDGLNRLVSKTDGEGNATAYAYDEVGRLLTETDPLGGETLYTYDKNGNLLSRTDPAGNRTEYTYDALNRVVTTKDALGGITTNTYDSVSNLISVEDPLGNTTYSTYYEDGRLKMTTDPLGNKTAYTYSANGQLETLTQADGGVVQMSILPLETFLKLRILWAT